MRITRFAGAKIQQFFGLTKFLGKNLMVKRKKTALRVQSRKNKAK
jgi:hypothetical protein